jgi:hypothetical protein
MQIIAVFACVVAAVIGTVSVASHSSPLQSIVGYVADVWVLAWVILNKAYTREYWSHFNRPTREIIQNPPARSGLARAVTVGMIALVTFDTVLWFVSLPN